jgi:hypothetical protein
MSEPPEENKNKNKPKTDLSHWDFLSVETTSSNEYTDTDTPIDNTANPKTTTFNSLIASQNYTDISNTPNLGDTDKTNTPNLGDTATANSDSIEEELNGQINKPEIDTTINSNETYSNWPDVPPSGGAGVVVKSHKTPTSRRNTTTQKGKIPKQIKPLMASAIPTNHDWQDDLVLLCHAFQKKSSDLSPEDLEARLFNNESYEDPDHALMDLHPEEANTLSATDIEHALPTESNTNKTDIDENTGPFGFPMTTPNPEKYTALHRINDAIDDHCFNRNNQLDAEKSITYRTFSKTGNQLPPHLQTDSKCHTILCAIDTLNNRSSLRGLKHHQKVKIVHRALRTSADQLRSLEAESARLATELLIRAPNKPIDTDTDKWGRYDLNKLGLNHIKSNLKNAHLTSEAAFTAVKNTSRKLPKNFAVLDTGATKHFITEKLAHKLVNRCKHEVMMCNANGQRTKVDKAGDYQIPLQDPDGNPLESLTIRTANIVPGSTFSLISAVQLIDEGINFSLTKDHSYMVIDGARFHLTRLGKMYVIDLDSPLKSDRVEHLAHYFAEEQGVDPQYIDPSYFDDNNTDTEAPQCALLAPAVSMKRMHSRLAHVSYSRIKSLQLGGAPGLNITNQGVHAARCKCESCLRTNKTAKPIPKIRDFTTEVTQKGELISSDIMGPFPPSPEGHRYAISFVDEFTRFSHVYFLKQKSEAVDALHSLVIDYKKSGTIIKTVQTDQAGEFGGFQDKSSSSGGHQKLEINKKDFYTNAFSKVCQKHEIEHKLVPAYRHEINGVAERWNRTVSQMANTMMYHARISPILWSSAIAHANFLRNRLPTRSRDGITPYELYFNRLPRYDNIRTWGCYCYKKLPKCDKTPGLPVRKRLIYVGDTANRIGFRCFDPIEFKFTTEYELIFDEEGLELRSEFLEAFDNRRKLAKQGKVSDIPIVSVATPNYTERTVYLPSELNDRKNSGDNPPVRTTEDNLEVPENSIPKLNPNSRKDWQASDEKHSMWYRLSSGTTPKRVTFCTNLGSETSKPTPDDCPERTTPECKVPSTSSCSPSATTSVSNNGTETVPVSEPPWPASQTLAKDVSNDEKPDTSRRRSTRLQHLNTGLIVTESQTENESVNNADEIHKPLNPEASTFKPRNVETALVNEVMPLPTPKATTPFDLSKAQELLYRNEFDLETNDYIDQHGPLSNEYITNELPSFEYHLTGAKPHCSRRRLPLHYAEPVTTELREFLQLSKRLNMTISVNRNNPKEPRSKSYVRYELTKRSETVRDYLRALTSKGIDANTASKDLEWDFCRGRITFPENTAPPSKYMAEYAFVLSYDTPIPEDDIGLAAISTSLGGETFNDIVKAMWPEEKELSITEQLELDAKLYRIVNALSIGEIIDPTTYAEATKPNRVDRDKWYESILKELTTLTERDTWEYVPRKSLKFRNKPIRCKYVFKKKRVKDGSFIYKTRLVACGYSQQPGIDYSSDELYASVCAYSSMRYIMSLATQKGLLLYQTDIKGAYLESYLKDELYMEIPKGMPGFEDGGKLDGVPMVCKLNRGLYGLKQSGHAWSECFKEFMIGNEWNMNFEIMTGESNVYRRSFELNGRIEEIIIGQYVDDCLLAASSQEVLDWYLNALSARFPVNKLSSGLITPTDPGLLLSMNVHYDIHKGILQFNQKDSIESLAKKFHCDNPHRKPRLPIKTSHNLVKLPEPESPEIVTRYLSIVGSCLHIAQVSRPDISYAVGVLSRHASTAGSQHVKAAEDLIQYLYSTRNLVIQYTRTAIANGPSVFEHSHYPGNEDEIKLRTIEERLVPSVPPSVSTKPEVFVDADLGGDRETRKSTSGMVITMNGGPIDWSSKLQKLCAQSSAEAEIYAAADSVKQALHIKLLCEECNIRKPAIPMTLWEDNEACIRICHGLKGSNNAKHFQLRLRFLSEHVSMGTVQFSKIDTKEQLADAFTKALPEPAFLKFRDRMLVPSSYDHNTPKPDIVC